MNVQRFSQCFLVWSRMPRIPCEKHSGHNTTEMCTKCAFFSSRLCFELLVFGRHVHECRRLSKIWYFAQMQRLRRVKFRYRSTLSICAGGAIENVLRLYFVRLAADCAENTTPGNPWLLLQFYIPQWFATVPHCFEASVQLVPTISFTSCLQTALTAIDFL